MWRRPPSLRIVSLILFSGALAALAPIAGRARAGSAGTQARSVRSVFLVAKSENRNEVHYGVSLDESCAPAGGAPVFAYWQMRERGPLSTEPLLRFEQPAYGLGTQAIVSRSTRGGRVVVTLNAVPHRAIAIDSSAEDDGCHAEARATIEGVSATLTRVFVQLSWPFGVDHVLIEGRTDAGKGVRERLSP
jgi:hypothetical protein